MEELFTDKAKEVLLIAQKEAKSYNHYSIGSEHLLLGLIEEEEGIAGKVLRELDLTTQDVRDELERFVTFAQDSKLPSNAILPYSYKARKVVQYAADEARKMQRKKVGTEHLLLGLLRDDKLLSAKLLENLSVDLSSVRQLVLEKFGINDQTGRQGQRRTRSRKQGMGGHPANSQEAGGTPTLDALARDLTAMAAKKDLDPIVGRDLEIRRITQVLSRRTKNNPVLVGEAGVGKTAIAEGLAQKIVNKEVPPVLQNKRLMTLDMGSLVAGTKYRGEFEDRMKKIINEIYNDGNVILFIDELHTLIGAGSAEGAIDASNLIKPALARGELQTIGATTLDEYQKHIEKDPALERRFASVLVKQPSEAETVEILNGLKNRYEDHHGVEISQEAVEQAVKLSIRYITDRQLPDKAIDLIDEASAKVRLDQTDGQSNLNEATEMLNDLYKEKDRLIQNQEFEEAAKIRKQEMKQQNKVQKLYKEKQDQGQADRPKVIGEDIADVVAQWTGIPVKEMKKEESQRLLQLEDNLHERVVGQEEAVKAVSKAIRRARSGLKDPNRPIGSFIFLGPTGVGKTELAKTVAATLFGSEDDLIRIDMSEFMEKHSTSRLAGSPPGYVGYDEGGQLTEKIRNNPYSVVLFDEVEKAHPDVFNMLLQVLDDGQLTDGKGRQVDFKNTVLIMTTNIGATSLRDDKEVGFGKQDLKFDYDTMRKRMLDELKDYFRPEFINRLDETIVFHTLDKDHLHDIVRLLAQDLVKRLADLDIDLKITPAAIDVIADKGYDPEYGARPLKRALQTQIEDRLSDALLSGEIIAGDKVTIGASKGSITLKVRERSQEAETSKA